MELAQKQWQYTIEDGSRKCSLVCCEITSAEYEDGVLRLYFEKGIIVGRGIPGNHDERACHLGDAMAEIKCGDFEGAITARVLGKIALFGKEILDFVREMDVKEWVELVNANPNKYEINDVYASVNNDNMLIQGEAVGVGWKRAPLVYRQYTFELELSVIRREKMHLFWNGLRKTEAV